MNRKKRKRTNLVIKWIFSYLLIFIIPVVVSTILYSSVEKIMRADINAASDYVLTQIQLSFDNITNEVYALSRQIAMDTEIGELMQKSAFSSADRLLIMKAVEKCAVYKATATSVDDVCIYLNKSASVIKHSGFHEKEELEAAVAVKDEYQREMWAAITAGEKSNKIISYAYVTDGGVRKVSVSYVMPIPLYTGEPLGFMMASVDKDRYREIVGQNHQNSDFCSFRRR